MSILEQEREGWNVKGKGWVINLVKLFRILLYRSVSSPFLCLIIDYYRYCFYGRLFFTSGYNTIVMFSYIVARVIPAWPLRVLLHQLPHPFKMSLNFCFLNLSLLSAISLFLFLNCSLTNKSLYSPIHWYYSVKLISFLLY